ncbi:MAG: 4Fe-4S binding protein [Bacilli bacterium]|nr:4Fe-4S binding protein [Bacilli bacterium]
MTKKETKEIYDRLLQVIDNLSFGFPKSYIRSDRKLIQTIFTVEDAQDYLLLEDKYTTAQEFADKNNFTLEVATEKLERLAKKGLIFRRHREVDEYRQYPFVLGFLEFQIHNASKEMLMHTALYMITSKFGSRMSQTMPFYRSIPINKNVVEGSKVEPYEDLDAILDRHTRFAVAPCMCRTMYKMKPFNKCHHPIETCITTDDYATFYIENGFGREISKEETREILLSGQKDGRIINVTNSKDGENICSCCACGCGMLYLKTKYPGPSKDLWSNYFSEVDNEKCKKCGLCVNKCPFKYIKQNKDKSIKIDQKACLGCGICAASCPSNALKLIRKENSYEPPETYDDAVQMWQEQTKKDYSNFR